MHVAQEAVAKLKDNFRLAVIRANDAAQSRKLSDFKHYLQQAQQFAKDLGEAHDTSSALQTLEQLLPKLEKALEAEPGTDSTVIQAASQAMDSALVSYVHKKATEDPSSLFGDSADKLTKHLRDDSINRLSRAIKTFSRSKPYDTKKIVLIPCARCLSEGLPMSSASTHYLDQCLSWEDEPGTRRCGRCGMKGHRKAQDGKRCRRPVWTKLGDEELGPNENPDPFSSHREKPEEPMQQ